MRAFDLAERFRCPVFLLTDKDLNMTMRTVDPDTLTDQTVRQRTLRRGDEGSQYRYQPPDGVPPIGRYGDEVMRFTGSSHTEDAVITKNPATVGALNEHLAAKIEDHVDEIAMVTHDPQDGATTLVLTYGVTAGAARAAVKQCRAKGDGVSLLVVQSLWPVPERAIGAALEGIERVGGSRTEPGAISPGDRTTGRRAPGGRRQPGRRKAHHARTDHRGAVMNTTIVPLATYRNETAYPFCPGCGHSSILDQLNVALLRLDRDPKQVVLVTDIGCSGLSDQYFTTSAFHGLHGRSLTYASGIKLARPELEVIVIMGDGERGSAALTSSTPPAATSG